MLWYNESWLQLVRPVLYFFISLVNSAFSERSAGKIHLPVVLLKFVVHIHNLECCFLGLKAANPWRTNLGSKNNNK